MTTLFSRNTVCSLLTWFELWYYENSIWFDIYIYNQKANCNGFICVFDTDASYNLSVFFFLSCLIPNIISCDIHRSGCIWWNLRSVILPSIFFLWMTKVFLFRPRVGIFHRFFGKWSVTCWYNQTKFCEYLLCVIT